MRKHLCFWWQGQDSRARDIPGLGAASFGVVRTSFLAGHQARMGGVARSDFWDIIQPGNHAMTNACNALWLAGSCR